MSFRLFLSLFLIGVGIGSPWLVQDWLDSSSSPGLAERAGGALGDWQSRWEARWKTVPSIKEMAPVPDAPLPDVNADREPYPLASQTRRVMASLLGRGGETSGPAGSLFPGGGGVPSTPRSRALAEEALRRLSTELAGGGFKPGDPVVLRVFKEEGELEVWLKSENDPLFALFKVHRLVHCAGLPGPKLREGDGQAPEGFYTVSLNGLRPETKNHLGLDLGYPNVYDRNLGRSGSELMIHGGPSAAGAFALSPAAIEEVYALAEASLASGNGGVDVHLFPFRMTDARMETAMKARPRWLDFWIDLKEGYDFFENVRLPPAVDVEAGGYSFRIVEGENRS